MTENTTNGLSCERARAFPIEKALAKLGHFPTKSTEKEAWFLSPFRSESQASFKVSKKLNRWYDHGAGKGGNVIDLMCQITNGTVKEALKLISEGESCFFFQQQPTLKKEEEEGFKLNIRDIKEINHRALQGYLKSRNIAIATARKLVKEIHYEYNDNVYFAIGLRNASWGWELRNKYYKSSTSPKDSSHIKNGKEKLIVTEGMFDMLSILETYKGLEQHYDFLVLNSTAFLEKALDLIADYEHIELYLDNDANGQRTTQNFLAFSSKCTDKAALYSGYKDVNQWHMDKTENRYGQQIQDVFLLPQKQTCFAPDGCKEKRK